MLYPNLRAEMARKGLSVAEVADKIGQKKEWLENRLSGKSSLPVPMAFEIQSKCFSDVDFVYLFNPSAIIPFREEN